MALLDLTGRVALVTGGGTRVGPSIARALARSGCDLVVHYGTSEDGARAVAEEARALGRRATTLRANLYDREALGSLARDALALANGRLDLLVNNAANFERVEPAHLTAEHWDRAM